MSFLSQAMQRAAGLTSEEEPPVETHQHPVEAPARMVPPIHGQRTTPEAQRSMKPVVSSPKRLRHEVSESGTELISFDRAAADGRMLEQLRTLRSRFCEISKSKNLKSIVVTSALPAEGKTLVAMNLASGLSKLTNRKVLLMECDLRKPRMQRALGLPSAPGMAELLAGNASFEEAGIELTPQFHVIPSTPTENAPELLQSPRMSECLARAAREYDFVLLDTPPISAVSDAEILASLSDGVLFVVRADQTDFTIAGEAINRIRPKAIGAVLNSVEKLPAHTAYYYGSQ